MRAKKDFFEGASRSFPAGVGIVVLHTTEAEQQNTATHSRLKGDDSRTLTHDGVTINFNKSKMLLSHDEYEVILVWKIFTMIHTS